MTNPYRAMCAELVAIEDALSRGSVQFSNQGQAIDGYSALATFRYVADKARILLAQQEPEALTDEEIMELMPQQMRDDLAAAARALAGFDRANVKAAGAMRIILNRYAVDHVRAVLAKWGTLTSQPVAVSERLPGPEDCLDEGWAWFFNKRIGWRQAVLPVSPGYTHWLPANALPTPEAQ
jgi:hypothetical protein